MTPDSSLADNKGEDWRKWKVRPSLVPMLEPVDAPERSIGKRIAYCRGQLDNLSVDALARYTKYFDAEGVSRQSLFRYEDKAIPGARELRILSDALWVSSTWLLFGTMEDSVSDSKAANLLAALDDYIADKSLTKRPTEMLAGMLERQQRAAVAQRQQWIDEARRPPPKE